MKTPNKPDKMDFNQLLDNKLVLGLTVAVLIATAAAGGFFLAQDPSTEQRTVNFNSTELLNSHQNQLNNSQPYSISLTAERVNTNTNTTNNSTLLYAQTATVDDNTTHIETTSRSGNTVEVWATPDTITKYNRTTGEKTQLPETPTDAQTQHTFLKQILLTGNYEFTEVSVTGPSRFKLTQVTDKDQLLYAYPGLTGTNNGTIENVTITGMFQSGMIADVHGTFDYTPQAQNASTTTYSFTIDVQRPLPPIQTPDWVQNTTTTE